jgi:hypothetical protein
MVSAWVEHIRDFARRKSMTYGCALSDPECRAEYHAKRPPKLNKKEKKEVAGMEAEDINILSIPVKKTRGRPKKYSTDEERKKAKTVKTVESNKRKRQEKKGMTGGMLSNELKKTEVNRIINFIADYVNTNTPDPEFERYIREDIGEDDIVSRFADTILGADIPFGDNKKLSQEDKLDLITDLNRYIKHYFPEYKDSNFKIEHIKKMRGGSVPPIPPKIKRGVKFIVPNNQIGVGNDNPPPPPPPPPPNTPEAPAQGRNRRRITGTGGKINFKKIILKVIGKRKKMTGTGSAISVGRKIPIEEMINIIFKKIGEFFDNNPNKTIEEAILYVGQLLENDLNNYNDNEISVIDDIIENHLQDYLDNRTSVNTPVNTPRGTGGKLKPPPANPLTQAQGREILDEVQTNGGNLLPVSQARQFNLRQAIERVGGFAPIEDMRDRFEFFIHNFLHPAQHNQVMEHYDRILALNPIQGGKLQGGKIPKISNDTNLLKLTNGRRIPTPPTNTLRDNIENPQFNSNDTGAFLVIIMNVNTRRHININDFNSLMSLITTFSQNRQVSFEEVRNLFEEGLVRFGVGNQAINEIMNLYDRIIDFGNNNTGTGVKGGKLPPRGTGVNDGNASRKRARTPSPIRYLNQTQGNALRDALHHLNSPITPQMIAEFGAVVTTIGVNNLRARFQGYLEGFTHPSSVARFLNRFDRLLSLFQDEAETDSEASTLSGGKLPLKFKSKIKKLGDKILPEPMRRNNMPLPQTLTQEEIAEQTFDNFMERVANTTAQRRPRRRNTPRPLTQEEIDEQAEDEAIEARLRGTGIIAGSNGLSHIYPLSHDNILKMCKHLA